MNEQELNVFVGSKIRNFRKKKGITQKELGEKIGVKHNTISSYENGTNAPQQNMLFLIAKALDKKVDDFFPTTDSEKGKFLDRLQELANTNLSVKDMQFLRALIEKTLSLDESEREKFLDSIRFTVEYHEKMKKN